MGRFLRLNRLNISPAHGGFTRSVIGVFFTTAKSTVAKFGPRKLLRPIFPNVPGAGCAHAAGVTHCSKREPPGAVTILLCTPAYGSPTRSARSRPSNVPLTLRPEYIVNGSPLYSR